MKKIITVSILLITVLVAGCVECESNTYSTCPNYCVKQCIPSASSGKLMTSDCDGPGSCVTPEEPVDNGIAENLPVAN